MDSAPLRLRRLVEPGTGRAVLLSFTAGMEVGLVPGLADLPATLSALAATAHVTGVIVHAGVLPSVFAHCPGIPCGMVVDLQGGTWMTTRPDRREQICSLEHAVRAGADGVLATVALGSADETRQLRLAGDIARDCVAWGLPLLVRIDTTQTDARRQYSAALSGHGARLAYEIGADAAIVNGTDPPQAFAEALRGVPIPVLLGGGPHMDTDEALIGSVGDALRAGARGVALSGPLFWHDGPTPALARVAESVLTPGRRPPART